MCVCGRLYMLSADQKFDLVWEFLGGVPNRTVTQLKVTNTVKRRWAPLRGLAIFPRCSLISECWAGGGACSWLSGDRPAGAAPCAVQGKAGRPSPRVGDRRAGGGGLPQSVSGPISPWDAGLAAHSQLWGHWGAPAPPNPHLSTLIWALGKTIGMED